MILINNLLDVAINLSTSEYYQKINYLIKKILLVNENFLEVEKSLEMILKFIISSLIIKR